MKTSKKTKVSNIDNIVDGFMFFTPTPHRFLYSEYMLCWGCCKIVSFDCDVCYYCILGTFPLKMYNKTLFGSNL